MDTITTPAVDLAALATLATQAASVHTDMTDARAEERAAQAQALAAIFRTVKPALRAIGSRPVLSETSGNDGLRSWRGGDSEERATWRGIALTGEPGPSRAGGRDDTRGDYTGTDVFLVDDATLVLVEYTGSWSRWQGEGSEWSATVEPLTLESFAAGWTDAEPERVAAVLAEAMERVIQGKASERAAASRGRAQKLRAVAALLG